MDWPFTMVIGQMIMISIILSKGSRIYLQWSCCFRTSGSYKRSALWYCWYDWKKSFSNGSWKKVNIDYTPNALGTGTIRYDYIDLGNGIEVAALTFNYDGKGKVPAFKGTSEVFWGFTCYWRIVGRKCIAFDALPVQGKVDKRLIYLCWSKIGHQVIILYLGERYFWQNPWCKDLRIYVDVN